MVNIELDPLAASQTKFYAFQFSCEAKKQLFTLKFYLSAPKQITCQDFKMFKKCYILNSVFINLIIFVNIIFLGNINYTYEAILYPSILVVTWMFYVIIMKLKFTLTVLIIVFFKTTMSHLRPIPFLASNCFNALWQIFQCFFCYENITTSQLQWAFIFVRLKSDNENLIWWQIQSFIKCKIILV